MSNQQRYTPEFRSEAVKLSIRTETIAASGIEATGHPRRNTGQLDGCCQIFLKAIGTRLTLNI